MQVVTIERSVGEMMFVGFHVVDLAQHFRVAVASCDPCDSSETRGHERRPIFHQNEVGALPSKLVSDAPPVERPHRIDATSDCKVGRRWCVDRLLRTRKEQRWVLQRKRTDVDRMSASSERSGHELHDGGQPSPIWVCGT